MPRLIIFFSSGLVYANNLHNLLSMARIEKTHICTSYLVQTMISTNTALHRTVSCLYCPRANVKDPRKRLDLSKSMYLLT